MKYKNDKHLNEVLGYVTHECQYYDQMDVKNRVCKCSRGW